MVALEKFEVEDLAGFGCGLEVGEELGCEVVDSQMVEIVGLLL